MVEYLLDNKADINSQNGNRGNQQPIHICSIIPGRDHIAKFLVQRGANYKSATMSYGAQTPVELAARCVISTSILLFRAITYIKSFFKDKET